MKLGILTFHKSINYGAFMQCYALSQRLQRDFPQIEVEVIDYHPSEAICAEEKNSISHRARALEALNKMLLQGK